MENLFFRSEFSLEIEIDRIMKRRMMPQRSRNDVYGCKFMRELWKSAAKSFCRFQVNAGVPR